MNIGFFGAGKMAEGILSAMADRSSVILSKRSETGRREIEKKYGVRVTTDVADVARKCEVLFLAVRPQDAASVAEKVKPLLQDNQTLVSIVAGKRLAALRKMFGPHVRLVRVMPNLALRAREGMCAIAYGAGTPEAHRRLVEKILGEAGRIVVLKERAFDAVTALSGSGPAYFAYMEEAMVEGGVALGLKPDVARLLAEQTMYGTAKFLRESKMDLRPFIEGVCTKGGTTEAGMKRLANPSFKRIVAATLKAAADRSKALGK